MKDRTLNIINDCFLRYPALLPEKENILKTAETFIDAYKQNKKILVLGNGGSASDSQHIAGELMKSFMLKRRLDGDLQNALISRYGDDGKYMAENIEKGIKCIPLIGFDALSTAFANDKTADLVFAQQVNSLGDKGDVLLSITTSGNSKNAVYACKLAKAIGLKTISLTGKTGGIIKDYSDITIKAPSTVVYEVQEYHLPIYHLICLIVESELFEN